MHQLRGRHLPNTYWPVELHELCGRLLFNLDWTDFSLHISMRRGQICGSRGDRMHQLRDGHLPSNSRILELLFVHCRLILRLHNSNCSNRFLSCGHLLGIGCDGM